MVQGSYSGILKFRLNNSALFFIWVNWKLGQVFKCFDLLRIFSWFLGTRA